MLANDAITEAKPLIANAHGARPGSLFSSHASIVGKGKPISRAAGAVRTTAISTRTIVALDMNSSSNGLALVMSSTPQATKIIKSHGRARVTLGAKRDDSCDPAPAKIRTVAITVEIA